jgi:hypothetical protein
MLENGEYATIRGIANAEKTVCFTSGTCGLTQIKS